MTTLLPVGTRIKVTTHDYDPDIYGRLGTIEAAIPGRAYPYHGRLDDADFVGTILFVRADFEPVA